MKKLLLLSVIASAMSYSASLSIGSTVNYDENVKFLFDSELKLENKNISGKSNLKLGEYTLSEKNTLLKNASFKNQYDFKFNLAKNLNLVAKTELNLEKKSDVNNFQYRFEPGLELDYKLKPYALFSIKGEGKKLDKGIKLGLNYSNDNFSNDLEFGSWYLSKLEANESFVLSDYITLENSNDIQFALVALYSGKPQNEVINKMLRLSTDVSKFNISSKYKPYELNLKEGLKYSKGNFETKNTFSVKYINKDISTIIKVPSSNQKLENIDEPFVFKGTNVLNNLTLNLKSQNSYKLSEAAIVKLDLENEFKNENTGTLKNAIVQRYKLSNNEFKLMNADHKNNFLKNEKSNDFAARIGFNYIQKIDDKNSLTIEPSVKFGLGYNLVKTIEQTENLNDDYKVITNITNIEKNESRFSVNPRVEAKYESKLNDNLTLSFKPFVELDFAQITNGEKYKTYKTKVLEADEKFKDLRNSLVVVPQEIKDEALKEKIKNGEEVKYEIIEKSKKPLSFNSVKAGARLELKYTW